MPQSSAAAYSGRVIPIHPVKNAAFGQSSALRAFKNAVGPEEASWQPTRQQARGIPERFPAPASRGMSVDCALISFI